MGNCLNSYDMDEIPHRFMEDYISRKNCEKCPNLIMDDGIVTCKYILESFEKRDTF